MRRSLMLALWAWGLCVFPARSAIPVKASAAWYVTAGQVEMLPEAPDFELKSLDGRTVRLRDYRGKAVVLNFWATWCVPCKNEVPWLVEYQKKYGAKGLVILGISLDASQEAIRLFVKKNSVNYSVLLGNQSIADRFYVKGLPSSIFIDRQGRITDQVPGMPTAAFLQNEIELALKN